MFTINFVTLSKEIAGLKRKSAKYIFIGAAVIALFVIFISSGRFLFYRSGSRQDAANETTGKPAASPVKYTASATVIDGNRQVFHILEVNPADKRVKVKPVLSFDSVFGFEKLSVMASRNKAYAAVNAGFFYEYGYPGGMVAIDGKLITNSTGKYPVLFIQSGKAVLKEIRQTLWLAHKGRRFPVQRINSAGKPGEWVIYTREYGTANRANYRNTTAVIENGKFKSIDEYTGEAEIPEDAMLLTIYESAGFKTEDLPFKQGDNISLEYDPALGADAQGYECGSWIIKDGAVAAGERDEWVGVLTNRDPRTAVGIKKDGTVVLLVVDGRQTGYSAGLTAKELGEYLLSMGVKDAAMLDGGASSEMLVGGKLVNRPSFKGTERPLGGGIIVMYDGQ